MTMTTKKTTTEATIKKPAEKKPVTKKVAAKSATEKKAVKKAAVKAVHPAPRTEGNPVAKKQPKPVFSIFDETAKKFVPAEGAKPITIPGLEAFQLFIHQTKDGRTWCVSEACSGGRLAIGSKREVAVQMASEMLNKHGKAGIIESIQRSINRTGAAPGFNLPTGIRLPDGIQAPADVKAEQIMMQSIQRSESVLVMVFLIYLILPFIVFQFKAFCPPRSNRRSTSAFNNRISSFRISP